MAVAPHPKKVTMAAVAHQVQSASMKLTVAAVALADSRKLDQPTHLGVVAVAAVELADQHNLANDSLRLEPAAVAHHHGMRIEPASMADHHEPASKEG